jgi:hypothetical protein
MFESSTLVRAMTNTSVMAFVAIVATTPLSAQATTQAAAQQSVQQSYSRAEQLLTWNTALLVSGDEVQPQWLLDGNRFWYRNKTPSGAEFVIIDPVRNTRALVFDNAKLAAAMSTVRDTSYEPNKLPFRAFKFTNDGRNEYEIEFTANRKRFVCDVGAYKCAVSDTVASEVPFITSPDKRTEAFISKNNVFVRPKAACAVKSRQGRAGAPPAAIPRSSRQMESTTGRTV